jgi:predicted 3-demethylubiquinone-9 3-methyltransferase (glyoxalase superfamily)
MNTKKRVQKITPFLWFVDGKAEEATNFYISLFKNSKIVGITRYGDEMPHMKGKVLTAVFELNGQKFMAIDGDAPMQALMKMTKIDVKVLMQAYEQK